MREWRRVDRENEMQHEVKKMVAKAKQKAYDELHERLDTN